MKYHNTIFRQLLTFIPRNRFQDTVDRHNGDHRIRTLSCWDQFVTLLFGQLSGRISLRDLVLGFNSKGSHHYHLGTKAVKRSSLSDANNKRPVEIFTETFFYLLEKVRNHLPSGLSKEIVRLIDSTTISLNLEQFKWAKFRSAKSGIKLHMVYDPNAQIPVFYSMTQAKVNDRKALASLPIMPGATYVVDRAYNDYTWYHDLTKQNSTFVGRMKSSACYKVLNSKKPKGAGITSDETIQLSSPTAQRDCPIKLRRICFIREEDNKKLVFISNDLKRPAIEIADLYKQRWQIELFFKWVKQNLKVKKFLGRSENAVKIQILVAMIAYLLIKLTQLTGKLGASLQQIFRLIGINLTSRRSIYALFNPDPGARIKLKVPPQLDLELGYA